MRKRRRIAGAALVLAALAILITPAGNALSQMVSPEPPDAPDALAAPEQDPGALDPACDSTDGGQTGDHEADDQGRGDDRNGEDHGRGDDEDTCNGGDSGRDMNLSARDEQRARTLVALDPRLGRVLHGRAHSIDEVGPWTDSNRLVGASLLLSFDTPQSFPMSEWPQIDYGSSVGPWHRYTESVQKFAADGITELMIDVDLRRNRVVGISPDGPDAQITPGPGFAPTEPTDPDY